MAQLPGALLPNYRWQATDNVTGAILPLAELYAYETGGTFSVLQSLYSDVDLAVALANPVVADSAGRFAAMFMLPVGYDLILKDADGNEIWRVTDIEDIGQAFLSNLGLQMAAGTEDVASGYQVVDGDWLVTTDANDATNPFVVNLPDLATWTTPLTIKHQSAYACNVTPAGTDEIENVAAAYALAAAASPALPTITLIPGANSWLIQSSHAL